MYRASYLRFMLAAVFVTATSSLPWSRANSPDDPMPKPMVVPTKAAPQPPASKVDKPQPETKKPAETKPAARKLTTLEGVLVEARCYFTLGATGGKHEYCSFLSMKANMPVGLLTAQGEFVYLVIESKRLANYATKTLRMEGEVTPQGNMLRPERMWVKNGSSWEVVRD